MLDRVTLDLHTSVRHERIPTVWQRLRDRIFADTAAHRYGRRLEELRTLALEFHRPNDLEIRIGAYAATAAERDRAAWERRERQAGRQRDERLATLVVEVGKGATF